MIPTIEVIHHTTPKISPLSSPNGGVPSTADGNEPGWIVVPTSSGAYLESDADKDKGGNNNVENRDDGSYTTLKWDYGAGKRQHTILMEVSYYDVIGAAPTGCVVRYDTIFCNSKYYDHDCEH